MEAGHRDIRILHLEDNPADAKLVQHSLRDGGIPFETAIVRSASDFQRAFGSGSFDLVLCDFTLPGWNGLDALRWVRERNEEIPFIYVSGTLGEEIAVECLKQGATDYLIKGNLHRLPQTVRRALHETELRRERDRAEVQLRRSEEQYRVLFDNNPQPMWVYDQKTLRFLSVNEATIAAYGYTRREFEGMTLVDIRQPEDVPALMKTLQRPRAPIHQHGEFRHRRKSGELFWVEITESTVYFGGAAMGLVVAMDVSARKKTEDALRRSEEAFRSMIEGAPLGVCRTALSGRILLVNPAMVAMLGYASAEELVGLDMAQDVYWNAGDRVDRVQNWRFTGEVIPAEIAWKRKDGKKITVRVAGRRIANGEDVFEAFVEDISKQKLLEEELRQAQKMEAVGRLAGGVAHDFNNLLMIINSYAQFLPAHLDDKKKILRDSEQIIEATSRAVNVTQQLLAFSRKQVVQPAVLNVSTLMEGFKVMLQRLIGEDIELTVVAEAKQNVLADRSQIEQTLMNLAVNARDAMPNGGRLTIRTSDVNIREEISPEGKPYQPGRYVAIIVADNGHGMSPEVLEHIFEPFFTTKDVSKGTGLGLSMVYGIVQQNGGTIQVRSEPEVGSTFEILFPAADNEQSTSAATDRAESRLSGSETIILTEDEQSLREVLREFLGQLGYRVLEAATPQEALELMHTQTFDLLITDIVMPTISGTSLAEKGRSINPAAKVIFISGYADKGMRPGQLDDATAFLQKPFPLKLLAQTIKALINHSGTEAI